MQMMLLFCVTQKQIFEGIGFTLAGGEVQFIPVNEAQHIQQPVEILGGETGVLLGMVARTQLGKILYQIFLLDAQQAYGHRFHIFFTLFGIYEVGAVFLLYFLQRREESTSIEIYEDGVGKHAHNTSTIWNPTPSLIWKFYNQTLFQIK